MAESTGGSRNQGDGERRGGGQGRGEGRPHNDGRRGGGFSRSGSGRGNGGGHQGRRSGGRGGRWEDRDGQRTGGRRDVRRGDRRDRRDGHNEFRGRRDGEFNRRRNEDDRRDRGYGRRDDRRDDRTGGRGNGHRNDRRDDRRDHSDDRRDDRRGDFRDRRDDRRGNSRGNHSGRRGHAQRGGQNQRGFRTAGPQRPGFREERINARINEPQIPEGVEPKDLDPSVRQELRSLSKDNADMVAKHLIMAATLLDDDPKKALEHARAAKDRAGRVAVARETNGIAAYHAGEWREAISELRAARRMSGGPGLLPVLADAERGLGRPKRAIDVANEYSPSELDAESRAELAIIVAGAYQDLDQYDEAVLALQAETGASDAPEVTRIRVFYAYADALVQAGRPEEAKEFFAKANELDTEDMLDAEERIAEL